MAGEYLLGIDVGSSSIKVALIDAESGLVVGIAHSPERELEIQVPKVGWAEQDPEIWWQHVCLAVGTLRQQVGARLLEQTIGIGVAYQMHGLVTIDKDDLPVRPAIIWCDGRAVQVGADAYRSLGTARCLKQLANSPGNFTVSKLAWLKSHEPNAYARVASFMLPGDYIALRLTGERTTTPLGLSEAMVWDVEANAPAQFVYDHFGISAALQPQLVPALSVQGHLGASAAAALGIPIGVPLGYRAGDQPNNAFALRVLDPGQVAAAAGTSGVLFAVDEHPVIDPLQRVNAFLHVPHGSSAERQNRYGTLLCLNGTGILYAWIRKLYSTSGLMEYSALNALAAAAPVGAEGLVVLPFGNGAERVLENQDLGASFHGVRCALHGPEHLARAALEGIACSFRFGLEVMAEQIVRPTAIRAANGNLFLSPLFRDLVASICETTVELFDTSGAVGAARAAGVGIGYYRSLEESFVGLAPLSTTEPKRDLIEQLAPVFDRWSGRLACAS